MMRRAKAPKSMFRERRFRSSSVRTGRAMVGDPMESRSRFL
jgi:hypothetical protein